MYASEGRAIAKSREKAELEKTQTLVRRERERKKGRLGNKRR